MKAVEGALNLEKAFSVVVKSLQTSVASSILSAVSKLMTHDNTEISVHLQTFQMP